MLGTGKSRFWTLAFALSVLGPLAACASRKDVDLLQKELGADVKRIDALEQNLRQVRDDNAKLGADLQGMREDVQTLSGKVDEIAGRRGSVTSTGVGGEDVLPALTRLQNDVWELKVRAGLASGPPPAPVPSSGQARGDALGLPTDGLPPAAMAPQAPPVTYLPPSPGGTPYTQPPQQAYAPAPAYLTPAPAYATPAPAYPPVAVPAPVAVAPPVRTPAPTPVASPEKALFDEAYKLFEKKQWQASREKFADFVKKYPASDLADNAHYWIGETYFAEGKYEPAFLEFEAVVKNYPKSDKACDARLKQGLSYKNLNYNVDARLAFQSVLKQCAGTDAAERAKKELGQPAPGR